MIRLVPGFRSEQGPADILRRIDPMDGPIRSAAGRHRQLMLAAIVVLGLVVAALAYEYFDALTDVAQTAAGGKLRHALSRPLHY
jgi:hypothetical protein